MSRPSSKTWLLIVLLLMLAGSIFYNFLPSTSPTLQTKMRIVNKNAKADRKDEVIESALLTKETAEFSTVHRNVFEFGGSGSSNVEEPVQAEVPDPPAVSESPQLPDVRYLAFYLEKDPNSIPVAAITNGGKVYVGIVGDVLAGKYKLMQIDDEFLLLRYLPDNRIIRLPIGKSSGVVMEQESAMKH